MALPVGTVSSLAWNNYTGDSSNLLAVVQVDLTGFSAVEINAAGPFGTDLVKADGVVIDNLLNKNAVQVAHGPLVMTVPGFQKDTLRTGGSSLPIRVSGSGGVVRCSFYRGRYLGNSYGQDLIAAQQVANSNTLGNGSLDAYFQTIKWKYNVFVPDGSDLDYVLESGFYDVSNPLNGPPGGGTWHVQVMQFSGSALWIAQTAYDQDSNAIYTRRRVNGTWSGWAQVAVDGASFSLSYLRVKNGAGGYIDLIGAGADQTRTGYLSFYKFDGVRAGYIGFANAANGAIAVASESGWYYDFNVAPRVNGSTIVHVGNFTTVFSMRTTGATKSGSVASNVDLTAPNGALMHGIDIIFSSSYAIYYKYLQWYWAGTWYSVVDG